MASDGSIVRRFVQYNKEGAVDDINIVSHNNRFTNLFKKSYYQNFKL